MGLPAASQLAGGSCAAASLSCCCSQRNWDQATKANVGSANAKGGSFCSGSTSLRQRTLGRNVRVQGVLGGRHLALSGLQSSSRNTCRSRRTGLVLAQAPTGTDSSKLVGAASASSSSSSAISAAATSIASTAEAESQPVPSARCAIEPSAAAAAAGGGGDGAAAIAVLEQEQEQHAREGEGDEDVNGFRVYADGVLVPSHGSSSSSNPASASALASGAAAVGVGTNGAAAEAREGEGEEQQQQQQQQQEEEEFLKIHPEALSYPAGFLGGISERTLPAQRDPVDESQSSLGYLRRILTSKVYDVAIESPLDLAPKLSSRTGNKIFLKREDMQQVFSFKLRGAYNMMANLSPEELKRGVICSSAGNHAQGVALAASRLGCSAVIAMPVTTPDIKWQSVQRLGAEVVLVGDAYDETQAYAKKRALEEGRVFVPPFDAPDVIAGQGTVGMEIIRQLSSSPLHAIFVPVGGGGLIAGIAAYVKAIRPEVLIIGVEPSDANAMALSLHHGQRVELSTVGKFADGVAVKMVGKETFRMCRELVDGVVLVTRDAICAAIKDMFEETRSILEPAGALSLAGAKAYCSYYGLQGENVVAVTSGANMNFDRLRLVTELADVGASREAVLATLLPEEKGSFKLFAEMVGAAINITEFKYRYNDPTKAFVLFSVGLHKGDELQLMMERLESAGLTTKDLTDNDLAKDHLRHLVGGRSNVENEALYRFVFPERPGALMKFLDFVSPRWNISLFHYRRQGEMGANILVGLQISPEEKAEFVSKAGQLGYEYTDEGDNEALIFMK